MAISLSSLQTSSTLRPPRILMHGVHGVGKTTFAAGADAPVVIMTEDGLGMLKVPHFPLATSYADVVEALDALLNEEHAYSEKNTIRYLVPDKTAPAAHQPAPAPSQSAPAAAPWNRNT